MFLLSSLFFCEFSFFGITKLERWGLLFLVFLFFYSTARILGFLSFFKSASSTSISSSPQPSDFRFSLKGLRRWNDIDIYYSPLSFSFPLFFFLLVWDGFYMFCFFSRGILTVFSLAEKRNGEYEKCVYVVLLFLLQIILFLFFSGDVSSVNYRGIV